MLLTSLLGATLSSSNLSVMAQADRQANKLVAARSSNHPAAHQPVAPALCGPLGFSNTSYQVGNYPHDVVVGKFNNDAPLDLVTLNAGTSGSVSVLRGVGNGTFLNSVSYTAGSYPQSLAVGDFDGDRYDDLMIANAVVNQVSELQNLGMALSRPPMATMWAIAPLGWQLATSTVMFTSMW